MLHFLKKHRLKLLTAGTAVLFSLTYLLVPLISFADTSPSKSLRENVKEAMGIFLDWGVGYPMYLFTEMLLGASILIVTGCAYFLDIAIRVSLGIGDFNLFGTTSPFLSDGVKVGWEVLRDIANMGFIFALIYIAIRTMLNIGGGGLQKQVIAVIIGALLINFSAFFSLVVIDAGNGLATVAYNQITRISGSSDKDTLKDAFGQFLKPQFMLKETLAQLNNSQTTIVFILATVLYLYAAYILIEAAFMFVVRTIYLMFSIIMAPLAFIAYAIPGLQGYLGKWFKDLALQSMIAPAYIIMLLFLFLFASKIGEANRTLLANGESLGDFVGGRGMGAIGAVFIYVFMLFMMKTCLKFARSVSIEVSGAATSLAGNTIGMLAGGAGGFAARNLLGRGASMLAKSEKFKDFAEKPRGFAGNLGRNFVVNRVKGVTTGSFDFRNSAAGREAAKQLSTKFGTPKGSGGFEAQEKATKEKEKLRKEAEKRYGTRQKMNADVATAALADSLVGLIDAATQARINEAKHSLGTKTPGLSIRQLEDLGAKTLKDKNVVSNLTASQVEAIMKSDKFSDTDKIEIAAARRLPLQAALEKLRETPPGETRNAARARVDAAQKTIRAFSEKEIDSLPSDMIEDANLAYHISKSQFAAMQKSGNLTSTQKDILKTKRMAPIEDILTSGATTDAEKDAAIEEMKKEWGIKGIPEFKMSVLTDPYVVPRLFKVPILNKLGREDVDTATLTEIRDKVLSSTDSLAVEAQKWLKTNQGRQLYG